MVKKQLEENILNGIRKAVRNAINDDPYKNNLNEYYSLGYNLFSNKDRNALVQLANIAIDLGGGRLNEWLFDTDKDNKTVTYPENIDMLNFYWQRYGGINEEDFRFILDPELKYKTFEAYLNQMPFKKKGAVADMLNDVFYERLRYKSSEKKTDSYALNKHINHIIKNKPYKKWETIYNNPMSYKYNPKH